MRVMRPVPLASLCLVGLVTASANAQSLSSLKGHDSRAPIEWTADAIEVQERANRVVLTGKVVAKQDELTLLADRVTIAYTTDGRTEVHRVDASGNVELRGTNEKAQGSFAIYDLDRELITMVGNVRLSQNQTNLNGQRLVLDLRSGRATLGGQGRVTGTFDVARRR